jgi:soluble lytic murein transglycosylase-like protein
MADAQTDNGGFLSGLLGWFGSADPAAAYQGLLTDPATKSAFRDRAMADAAAAFGAASMPVPYKGGIPLGEAFGSAAKAAYGGWDDLVKARLAAAQTGVAQQGLLMDQAIMPAIQRSVGGVPAVPGAGGAAAAGTTSDQTGPTGPAKILASGGGSFAGTKAILDGKYGTLIQAAAAKYNLQPEVLAALIHTESSGNPTIVSSAGAVGLGQLMPDTAKYLGVTDRTDPAQNIEGSAKYLREGIDATGNIVDGLKYYYSGSADPKKWGEKTLAYPKAVLSKVPAQPQQAAVPGAPAAALPPTTDQPPAAAADIEKYRQENPQGIYGPPGGFTGAGAPPAGKPAGLLQLPAVPDYSGALGPPGAAAPPQGASAAPVMPGGVTPVSAPGGAIRGLVDQPPPAPPPAMRNMPGRLGGMGPQVPVGAGGAMPPGISPVANPGGSPPPLAPTTAGSPDVEPAPVPVPAAGGGNLVPGGAARPPIQSLLGPMPAAPPPSAAPPSLLAQPPVAPPAAPPPAAPPVPQGPPPAPPMAGPAPPPVAPPSAPAGPIPGAPTPQQIQDAQAISAWAMARGRTVPPNIAEIAKFPLVGPTAQAQAAGTAAGQQPYLQQNEAQKAEVTSRWQLWVDQNKPILTRPNTLQINPVTGDVYGNFEAAGTDGAMHRYMIMPGKNGQPQKIDLGQSALTTYQTEGPKAVASKNAEDYQTVIKEASGAPQTRDQATFMRQEAKNFYTGAFAPYNQDLNRVLLALNPDNPERANKVASYEAFIKDAGYLSRQQAKDASSKAGVQELKMVANSMPSEETSPRGLDRVLGQIQGLADYRLAKQAAMNQYVNQPGRGGWDNNGFEAQFNANISPYTFMYMRLSDGDRAEIRNQLAQSKDGQADLQRLQGQIKYLTDNNLLPR